MKKIMFHEQYGLQRAAIDGTKTMTRRVIKSQYETIKAYSANCETYLLGELDGETFEVKPCYYIGEVVAIAQSYKDAGYIKEWVEKHIKPNPRAKPTDPFERRYPGWNNKMFVKADIMPNRIRITDIKIERLQDISDEDCLKEGVKKYGFMTYHCVTIKTLYDKSYKTPRDAFAALIDKVSGRGTWKANPWVFAYSFEVVKK